MGYRESYRRITNELVEEHKKVFSLLSMEQLEEFMSAVVDAKNIFVMAAGREGISLRAFAMRLAHLGKNTSWVWDDTTTGVEPGDLFVISDGRGCIGSFRYTLEKVKEAGGKVAMFTANPDGANAKAYADIVIFVRSQAYLVERGDVVPTIQMMGNQYEQHLYMLCDVIIMLLVETLGLTYDDLEARHRNVE
jgi:6-phospho-3-hexuloisomerase